MKKCFNNAIKQLKRLIHFIFHDIPDIMYDFEEDGKAYLSLPRLMFTMSGFLLFTAYIREHMFGVPYENMSQLVMFFTAAAGGYIGKRWATVKKEEIYHGRKGKEGGE